MAPRVFDGLLPNLCVPFHYPLWLPMCNIHVDQRMTMFKNCSSEKPLFDPWTLCSFLCCIDSCICVKISGQLNFSMPINDSSAHTLWSVHVSWCRCDHMVVRFTSTNASQCLSLLKFWVQFSPMGCVHDITLYMYDKVCHWLEASSWFSPVTRISFFNKTDFHDVAEKLLIVALSTHNPNPIDGKCIYSTDTNI